jgi:2-polyprenyl-6-methoxyphenol hydroxylase-like FAD-dependent oxidoreductase
VHVAIVGAGPAGAATALLLARAGATVTLIERERHFERVFRGEALMPTGLDALHQMGLRDALDGLPWRHLEAWEIYLERRPILRIAEPTARLGDRALRVVAQPKLLELLVERARAVPGFAFRAPATVRGLLRRGERVAGVRGADGRASLVRSRAALALDLLPESYDILWIKLPPPAELVGGPRAIQIFASGPQVALAYVSWDDAWHIAWMLPKGSWREVRQRDWLADCARLIPEPLAAHLLAHRTEISGPVLLDVVVGRCPRWHAPGVLLLGDAAHPMSPVRAQGINMALRDAIVAANHLAPAIRTGAALDPVLAGIQREREREIARVQRLQLREVRGQRWARERPRLMKPLLRLAPLLARTGLVQRLWLRQQRPLREGTTEVRLHALEAPPAPPPG